MEIINSPNKSLAIRDLNNAIDEKKQCTIIFRSRKDGTIHKIFYEYVEEEIKIDEDGIKWKRIYD